MNEVATVDPESWLDSYGDILYRFAFSRLRNRDSAEEVVQETLVSALRNRDQFSGRGSEKAWLIGILKRKIVDLIRSRKRDRTVAPSESSDFSEMLFDKNGSWQQEMRSAMKNSFDSLDRKEFWQILRKCMELLPSRHADVFTLRVMEQEEAETVCEMLEISQANYWVMLHRARLQLAGCMTRRWFLEGN